MLVRNARPSALLAVVAALVLLAGCGGGDDKKEKAKRPLCGPATAAKARQVKDRKPPSFRLDPAKTYVATVETSCGVIKITLDSKRAPKTGGSFVSLARKGFYNGLLFHRVVHTFVVQGGDPTASGAGGPGYRITERPPKDLVYSLGVVAMAKTPKEPTGASGSQFFIVTADDAELSPVFALLGRVTSGIDVVHAIENVDTDQTDRPFSPIVIKKITITES